MPDHLWSALLVSIGFASGYFVMSRKKDRKFARLQRRERRQEQSARLREDSGSPGNVAVPDVATGAVQVSMVPAEGEKLVRRELEAVKTEKERIQSELKSLGWQLKRVQSDRDALARKVEALDGQLQPLRAQAQQAEIEQRAQAKAKSLLRRMLRIFRHRKSRLLPGAREASGGMPVVLCTAAKRPASSARTDHASS